MPTAKWLEQFRISTTSRIPSAKTGICIKSMKNIVKNCLNTSQNIFITIWHRNKVTVQINISAAKTKIKISKNYKED